MCRSSSIVGIQSATAEIMRGKKELECGQMSIVMVALPNTGGAVSESS